MNTFLLLIRFSLLATLACTLSACGEEEGDFRTLRLRVIMPEGYEDISLAGRKVILSNQGGEMRYEETTDTSGSASFRVECGFYAARLHFAFRPDRRHRHPSAPTFAFEPPRHPRGILRRMQGSRREVVHQRLLYNIA